MTFVRETDQPNVATKYCENVNQMVFSWSVKHGYPCIFFFFTSIVKKLYILSENKNSFQSLEIEIKTFGNIHCVNVLRDKGIIFFFFFTFRQ